MRKITVLVLTVLMILSMTACGINGKAVVNIESYEWKMRAVMKTGKEESDVPDDELVIAVGEQDELSPDAKVADIMLTAKNGEITLTDATNNKTFAGTYEMTEETSKSVTYAIIIDNIAGSATIKTEEHIGNRLTPTLPVELGDYTVYFLPDETGAR